MRGRLIAAMCLSVTFGCGGKISSEGVDGGALEAVDGGALDAADGGALEAAEGGVSDARPGADAKFVCVVTWGGGSSGGSSGGGSVSDITWIEKCSDGKQYTAACYCLSGGGSNCCCSTDGTANGSCGGFSGEGGIPFSPCSDLPGPALMACGFPTANCPMCRPVGHE